MASRRQVALQWKINDADVTIAIRFGKNIIKLMLYWYPLPPPPPPPPHTHTAITPHPTPPPPPSRAKPEGKKTPVAPSSRNTSPIECVWEAPPEGSCVALRSSGQVERCQGARMCRGWQIPVSSYPRGFQVSFPWPSRSADLWSGWNVN